MQGYLHKRRSGSVRPPGRETPEGLQLAWKAIPPLTNEEMRMLKQQIQEATERFLDEIDRQRIKPLR
jgi:hypothetical protein